MLNSFLTLSASSHLSERPSNCSYCQSMFLSQFKSLPYLICYSFLRSSSHKLCTPKARNQKSDGNSKTSIHYIYNSPERSNWTFACRYPKSFSKPLVKSTFFCLFNAAFLSYLLRQIIKPHHLLLIEFPSQNQ